MATSNQVQDFVTFSLTSISAKPMFIYGLLSLFNGYDELAANAKEITIGSITNFGKWANKIEVKEFYNDNMLTIENMIISERSEFLRLMTLDRSAQGLGDKACLISNPVAPDDICFARYAGVRLAHIMVDHLKK